MDSCTRGVRFVTRYGDAKRVARKVGTGASALVDPNPGPADRLIQNERDVYLVPGKKTADRTIDESSVEPRSDVGIESGYGNLQIRWGSRKSCDRTETA